MAVTRVSGRNQLFAGKRQFRVGGILDKIELVARAMCAADQRDPDAPVAPYLDPDDAIAEGDKPEGQYLEPRWMQYVSMARRQIAAFNSLIEGLRNDSTTARD